MILVYYDYDKFGKNASDEYAETNKEYPFVYGVFGKGAGAGKAKDMLTGGLKLMKNAKKIVEFLPSETAGIFSVQKKKSYKGFAPELIQGDCDGISYTGLFMQYSYSKYEDDNIQTYSVALSTSPIDIDYSELDIVMFDKSDTDKIFLEMENEAKEQKAWW